MLEVNRRFYAALYAIAQRPRLYELIIKHLELADLYRRMAMAMDQYYKHTIADHENLVSTLRQHDPVAVERLVRMQLQQTARSLISFLRKTSRQPSTSQRDPANNGHTRR